MRPPICAICDDRFMEGGGLVQFKLTDAQRVELKRFEQPGFVGHPPGLEWFCPQHLPAARELSHLTLGEAMAKMRSE